MISSTSTARVRELAQTREAKLRNLDQAVEALLDHDASQFIDLVLDDYLEGWPNPDLDLLWREYGDDDWTLQDFAPYLDRLRRSVFSVENVLFRRNLLERTSFEWETADERSEIVESFDDRLSREVAEKWLKQIEEYWRDSRPRRNSPYVDILRVPIVTPAPLTAARMTIRSTAYNDLRRAKSQARNEVEVVELELKHALTALHNVRKPRVGTSIAVLQVITLFAVIIPLGQMAIWGSELDRGQRILFVILFVISLILFFIYIAYEVKRIAREPDPLPNGSAE
ncbi:hypothetical protein [Dactylosporangium sp. NPDC051484]|uniref:hypothetical protein n=1 Tax=Dactylosporangium sp. NPDC051484 TaxID=3154942 RepID=UPI00344B2207